MGFDAVFEAYRDSLLRLAGLLCGNAGQAEDAVAEAFARVYRPWRRGRVDNVGAYLRRAVVNEVLGGSRRRVLARRVRLDPPPGQPPFDAEVAEHDRVWHALLTLPERQRAALVLRFCDDLPEAHVAEVLGVPVGTVKSTVSRGLARLRLLLREEDDYLA